MGPEGSHRTRGEIFRATSDPCQVSDKIQKTCHDLLAGNARFIEEATARDPDYFTKLADGQRPVALWIGCSDSRVPANQITGTDPGDIFVHRNIANLVIHTDPSMLSVLQYAVEVLEVPHVIVCGHYGCGGVEAALTNRNYGLINQWLRNIKDVYRVNEGELKLLDRDQVLRRVVELNVMTGVHNLCETAIIQQAWAKRGGPEVHGWVYGLADGRIKDLGVNFHSPESLHSLYRYQFVEGPKGP